MLRTPTYMGGSSNDSHFDIVAIGEENSVTVPAGMVGMVQTNAPFALVDDFWNRPSNIARVCSCESFAYRVDTDQDCDDIPYPATRTVSDQARENDNEGLTHPIWIRFCIRTCQSGPFSRLQPLPRSVSGASREESTCNRDQSRCSYAIGGGIHMRRFSCYL